MLEKEPDTVYWLDGDDKIIKTSESWDEFAKDNDGDALVGQSVIGVSIWDFIEGNTTCAWMSALFSLARLHQKVVERAYRCDSPGIKREMKMILTPEESGVLKVEHKVVSVEAMKVPAYFQAAMDVKTNGVVIRCSICNRVKEDGEWIEAAFMQQNDSSEQKPIKVAYGVCGNCTRFMPGAS